MQKLVCRSLVVIAWSVNGLGLLTTDLFAQATKTLHVATDPVPREGGWLERHEGMNARVAQGNVDLIFIGDSITQGWETEGQKAWGRFYGHRHAVNLGISGDRTQHVLWRLDHGNLQGISPKAAVIMIGTNNSRDNSAEEIADGITAIVESLREKTPDTKILLLAIFPRGATPDDPQRQVTQKANAIVAKLADDQHVFFLDIGKKFLHEDETLGKDLMPDLLHLSEQGYAVWAESIESLLAKLMAL